MSDDPERPRTPLSDEQRRSGAQKLSALLRAQDDAALQRFRRQRADHAEENDLEVMRAVLEALALQLEEGDGEGWERVRAAWARLSPPLPPQPEELEEPATPSDEPADDKPSLEKALTEIDNPPIPVVPASAWLHWSREGDPPRWEAPDYSETGVTPALEPNVDETVPLGQRIALASADATGAIELPEARDPLPFKRSEDDPTKQHTYSSIAHALALDVEEYAALCAERDWSPERRNTIYERYDVVTDRCREALDRAYELRFARDPALRSLWQQYYVRFSTALKARQG
ncbi:MAG TPA: hypothetical protein VFB62_07120 [Polyangiaceae bacterium]|nr:hypothetical protein [Polyangiaceae bacterium]